MQMLRRIELAKKLGVHPRTVDHWRKTGILPQPVMLGSIPVWSVAAIEEWLRQQEARP